MSNCENCIHKYVCKNYPVDSLSPIVRQSIVKKLDEECKEFINNSERLENPPLIKTFLSDFLEKYPNAPLEVNGTPKICPYELGYCEHKCNKICVKCWNTPMEDK